MNEGFERGVIAALQATLFDGDRSAGVDTQIVIARGWMSVRVDPATLDWHMTATYNGPGICTPRGSEGIRGNGPREMAVALGLFPDVNEGLEATAVELNGEAND